MAISLTAVPGMPHATSAQRAFDEQRQSHEQAMEQSKAAEKAQYDAVLRQLLLYAQMKAACDATQKTTLGQMVGLRTAELAAETEAWTAAILQGLADATGQTLDQVCDHLKTVALPAEIQAARAAIAAA